jgi:inhibitor of KinA sporulation pathway (predicted exonuclease)
MFELPPQFILFDTEYTAWEGSRESDWKKPGQYKEIIQIGALKVEGATLAEKGEFSIFVKPVKNPELSDFITNLTGITQEVVDSKGVSLENALLNFSKFVGDLEMYSYGIDAQVIKENCDLLGIDFPLKMESCHNLRPMMYPELAARNIPGYESYTSGTLLEAFGKEGGRAHDAVNDMRNLLVVLRELRA